MMNATNSSLRVAGRRFFLRRCGLAACTPVLAVALGCSLSACGGAPPSPISVNQPAKGSAVSPASASGPASDASVGQAADVSRSASSVAAAICKTARGGLAKIMNARDANAGVPEIEQIISLNNQHPGATPLYYQVWQLADAYRGARELANDPDLGNGAAMATVASLQNLVEFCDTRGQ
jgi:hypothetical protein